MLSRAALLLAVLVACVALPAAAAAAPDCARPADRDAEYLCPAGPEFQHPPLVDAAGWGRLAHFANILYGDLFGDRAEEMVARGPHGIEVYRWSEPAGQWTQLAVPPILPDREGWGNAAHFATLDLGDVDGDGRAELVARAIDGVRTFRFEPSRGGAAGSWTELRSATRPLPIDSPQLRAPQYYETIGLSPIGALPGKSTMQLVGRLPDGLHVWRWTDSGWQELAALPALGDAGGWTARWRYLGIEAWDREYLFARGEGGMIVFRYLAAENSWRREADGGRICVAPDRDRGVPCDLRTVQLVHDVPGAGADPVLLARDSRPGYGIFLARYDRQKRSWVRPDQKPNPWNEARYAQVAYRATIQAADVDGDGAPEVLGRGDVGIAVFKLNFRSDGLVGWGAPRSLGVPRLLGERWEQARHFTTIDTVRLRGGSKARSLIARGPLGMRTWSYDAKRGEFERPRPYGRFPAIAPRALEAVSDHVGIVRGTVRDLYADPTRTTPAQRFASVREQLERTCSGQTQASPPSFTSCSGRGGISDAEWASAAGPVIRELYWAEQVAQHFGELESIEAELFQDQQGIFPSITADMRIAKTPPASFGVDVKGLMWQIFETVINLDIPVVSQTYGVTAMALGIAAAATPRWSGEVPSAFDVTAAQLQRRMAEVQQELRDTTRRQRAYVAGDPGLLETVGREVASGTWELDRQLALSAGREAFTRYVYRAVLPTLWDHWTVLECSRGLAATACHAPRSGPLLSVAPSDLPHRDDRIVDFRGLVPKQDPCDHDFRIGGNRNCTWTSLEDWGYADTVKTLLDPIDPACRYDPVRRTSWHYGCSLGEDPLAVTGVLQPSPWEFRRRSCVYPRYTNPAISCHVQSE